jgi:hypothetical protein
MDNQLGVSGIYYGNTIIDIRQVALHLGMLAPIVQAVPAAWTCIFTAIILILLDRFSCWTSRGRRNSRNRRGSCRCCRNFLPDVVLLP